MCGGAHHDGGVVNENIDSTPFLDDSLDDPLATGLVSDILGDLEALSTSGVDELLGLVGIDLLLGEVDNGDLRAIPSATASRCRFGSTHVGSLHGVHDSSGSACQSLAPVRTGIRSGDLPIPESPPVTMVFLPTSYDYSVSVVLCIKLTSTHLSSRLVLVKAVVALLDGSALWLNLHVILDTDDAALLRLYGKVTWLGELSWSRLVLGGLRRYQQGAR